MDDTEDFTFCQAGLRVDDEQLDSHENIPNISRMTLEDNNLNGGSMYKIGSSLQYDNLQENERLKASGSKVSPSRSSNFKQISKSKLIESLTRKIPGGNGRSSNQLQEQKTVIKKPAVRAKVPFEIGYSPMDWLKLTRTEPDLAGLKGQSDRRLISFDEVKQHKAEEGSIWTVLKGRVYNISPYLKFHPGGADMLMKAAGKDCTLLFNKYHSWVNDEFLLEKCLVGILESSL